MSLVKSGVFQYPTQMGFLLLTEASSKNFNKVSLPMSRAAR
jgi:hypothetical protein